MEVEGLNTEYALKINKIGGSPKTGVTYKDHLMTWYWGEKIPEPESDDDDEDDDDEDDFGKIISMMLYSLLL